MTRFSDGNSSGYRTLTRDECVTYARDVSGIQLRGDAWTWWDKAAGVYKRGQYPAMGAMLVLAKTNKLRLGHLAVVNGILGPRDISVTHANWGNGWLSRRIVYESMRVQDSSPNNDWSTVRFWNHNAGGFGSNYAVKGFIYNQREP
ncbi:MAG: CHAP domain-containing protein [Alphaproteobacteria bacterium]|nr:CHAP domain-containing protein [Alphaproteobacteria bacterium]